MGIGAGKPKNGRGVYSRTKIIYAHIIVWAIFITYELSALYYIVPHFTSPLDIAIHYGLNISLFYFNSLFLFPKTYKSKSVVQVKLFVGIILELILYLTLLYSLDRGLAFLKISVLPFKSFNAYVVPNTYRGFFMILMSTGYWLGTYLLKSRIEIDSLIQQQLEDKNEQLELQRKIIISENAFLKAQINPHFLFNSLSFIYNTIHKLSASAAEAVILLSDVTRYSLRKSDVNGQMPIHEEIEQISNLIELNQLRFNGELQIKFEVGIIPSAFTIPPLLLISFVENIFKYGKLNNSETQALISIKEVDGVIQFRTKNIIQKRKGTVGYGVGLENTRLRLSYIFPDKHRLNIIETENTYTIELDIQMSHAEELYTR
jgi:two-component system LytT family sensor kinase